MMRRAAWLAVCLALLAVMRAVGAPVPVPRLAIGPYALGVERVARVRELERPVGQQVRTAFVLWVEAKTTEDLDKVIELCRDPAAADDVQRSPLTFTTVGPCGQARKLRRYAEVVFSGVGAGATRIRYLQGTLVYYEGRRHYALEAAAEPGETAETGGVKLNVASAGPGQDDTGKERLVVRLELSFLNPAERAWSAEEWQGEALSLLDSGGVVSEPLSSTHQYRYDAQRRLSGVSITAYFETLPEGRLPAELRYRVDRLTGLKALPYRFDNLSLP